MYVYIDAYIYMCVYVYIYICIYVYMYIYIFMYLCICIYLCIFMYLCILMYLCSNLYMYIYMYIYIYINIYFRMYIYFFSGLVSWFLFGLIVPTQRTARFAQFGCEKMTTYNGNMIVVLAFAFLKHPLRLAGNLQTWFWKHRSLWFLIEKNLQGHWLL